MTFLMVNGSVMNVKQDQKRYIMNFLYRTNLIPTFLKFIYIIIRSLAKENSI